MLELAENIEAAQGPEIDALKGWLESWGEGVPPGDTAGRDDGDMSNDSGDATFSMVVEEEMNDLKEASGAA